MARSKGASSTATKTVEDKPNELLINTLSTREIRKQFGDDVIVNGQFLVDNPKEVISVSPALDSALGGGFQVGSFVVLAGQPRTGKTTTALHFAARCQGLGRRVMYVNAEHRLETRNLADTPGLRPDELIVVQSRRNKILTAQDFLSITYTYLTQETDLVVIIDSISVLSEEREVLGGIGTETRGGSGKLMAQFCRLATPVIPVNSHIVIGIAQLYNNTSGMGKKYLTSMGKKVDYALYTSLYATHMDYWSIGSDEDKNIIGQINHWQVERSPISQPGLKVDSYLRYGVGIDEIQEYMKFAEDLKLFEKSGSWYAYPNSEQPLIRAQGMEKFRQALTDNPEALDSLKKRVRELVLDEQ